MAKNNYMWSSKIKGLDFIANGDVAIVQDIRGVEERYGYRFANVRLWLPDSDAEVDCKIFLDTLTDEGASVSGADMRALAEARMADPEVNASDTPMRHGGEAAARRVFQRIAGEVCLRHDLS